MRKHFNAVLPFRWQVLQNSDFVHASFILYDNHVEYVDDCMISHLMYLRHCEGNGIDYHVAEYELRTIVAESIKIFARFLF